MTQPPPMPPPGPKPWEVPQTPQGMPPAPPAADPSMDPGLLEAIKRLFMGNQQPPPLAQVPAAGQGANIIDPLQQAARFQQRNQAIGQGTGQ